jgi:NitT/TauT family transport system ATP-binding protein
VTAASPSYSIMTGHPETAAHQAMADPQAASPAELPLPRASGGGLDGMLRTLSARGGRGDLPELVGRLSPEVDDLIPPYRRRPAARPSPRSTTPTSNSLQSASDGRKPARPTTRRSSPNRHRAPLVRTIVRALSDAPDGKLSRQFFPDVLEHDFIPEQARAQLDTAIHCGRHGELYTYHARDGQFASWTVVPA